MAIRIVIEALVTRGNVEVDEVEHLDPPCTVEEARALIPAWTNSALARVLDRTLNHLRFDHNPPSPWWALYFCLQIVQKSISRPIGQVYAHALAVQLASALAGVGNVTEPITKPSGYLLETFLIATEAQQRLAAWPAIIPVQQ